MLSPLDPLLMPLAAIRLADGLVMLILVAFTWWGARRGAVRQVLSLGVLVGSLWAAGRYAGRVSPTVESLTSLEPAARLAVTWAALLFAGLVAGAILLSFACCRLASGVAGGANRVLGGVLGMLKGALVVTIAGYLLLAVAGSGSMPGLSRTGVSADAPRAHPPWIQSVRGSVLARALPAASAWLRPWLDLPAWIESRIADVDGALTAAPGTGTADPAGGRRPTDR